MSTESKVFIHMSAEVSVCPAVSANITLERTEDISTSHSSYIHSVKPSRYARIFLLRSWLKQGPMDCSASLIRLWKRSRSLAISSQFPLREACRAYVHVRTTWTCTTGENRTWKSVREGHMTRQNIWNRAGQVNALLLCKRRQLF